MKQEEIYNYQYARKVVSWLNSVAVVLAIAAFLLRRPHLIYLMSLALVVLLCALIIVMHFAKRDSDDKNLIRTYHLIAIHLILTICSFYTSAKISNYNNFSYVFIYSLQLALQVLIALQLIFEKRVLLISLIAFLAVFLLSLFQINLILNIVLALIMATVIFSSLTKLMKPLGIYGLIFGVIGLALAIVALIFPFASLGFYGHILVDYVIVSLYFTLIIMSKND